MKKTKVIIPALAVMLLSTAASVSGTVAWFSMNNFVTASGMNIQAKAENGIVISNSNGNNAVWKETATAAHNTALQVYPTSTYNATTWAHGSSSDSDVATTTQTNIVRYDMLSPVDDADTGAGYVNTNGQSGCQIVAGGEAPNTYEADALYYLKNSFYIKSSSQSVTQTIKVSEVTVSGQTTSLNLDKALRVLVKYDTTALIFAPFDGATLSYTVCTAVTNEAASSTQAVTANAHNATNVTFLANQVIPAFSASPLQIDIYLYFEGEDEACKSTNLNVASLDSLSVSVKFGTIDQQ